MTAYTDDDVTAAAEAIREYWDKVSIHDKPLAKYVLAAVAPAIAARARREAADVPCRFCHTPASTHDVTSCPRHFYHPEWMLAEGSSDE